ncbi:MAG: class I tRNA ligase family protein, partial [Thiomargarita sp.]|nr:class I tRNA ligase family protein [Thiomargarita sp.]
STDQWIISLLQQLEKRIHQHFKNYRFDLAAQALYEFTWNEYCDWYLEFSKPILQEGSEAAQRGTRQTLVRVLETLLRLLHPIIPFITEELWQRVAPLAGKSGDTLMLQPYPQPQSEKIDIQTEQDIEWVKQVILGVRRIRAEMNIIPSKRLPVLLQNGNTDDQKKWQKYNTLIISLARLDTVNWVDDNAPDSAIALVAHLRILIPMAGLIDKEAEIKRLTKEIEKLTKEVTKCRTKLDNPNFTKRAPADIVAQEQERVTQMTASLQQLETQARKIRAM